MWWKTFTTEQSKAIAFANTAAGAAIERNQETPMAVQ
jgi:hypothetical protein